MTSDIRGLEERLRIRAATMNEARAHSVADGMGEVKYAIDALIGYYAKDDAALDRETADALASLLSKVEELERTLEVKVKNERKHRSLIDKLYARAEAAEAKVERLTEALTEVVYKCLVDGGDENLGEAASEVFNDLYHRPMRERLAALGRFIIEQMAARALSEVKP